MGNTQQIAQKIWKNVQYKWNFELVPPSWNRKKYKRSQSVLHHLSASKFNQRVPLCSSLKSRHISKHFLAKIISINQKWIVYNYIQRNENEWLALTEKRESLKVMLFYLCIKTYKYYLPWLYQSRSIKDFFSFPSKDIYRSMYLSTYCHNYSLTCVKYKNFGAFINC